MLFNQIIERQSKQNLAASQNRRESVKRSLAKTISWRAVGTLDTILISWLITGAWAFAVSIGVIELFTKMILYFFHERLWSALNYGK